MKVRSSNQRQLQDGEILFYEGDASDCAYIIESGHLEITTESNDKIIILATLGEGDIVGEMGIIDQAPRTATVRAKDKTNLIIITRDSLTDRLSGVDPIILFIVKTLLERYRSGLDSVRGRQHLSEEHQEIASDTIIKMRLEASLKEALELDQLEIYYQPLLDIHTQKITGFEALARWQHPVRGSISPQEFIALAEETSLILPIGSYIFDKACKQLSHLAQHSKATIDEHELFMSINVSIRQIEDDSFIQQIIEICDRYQVKHAQISLEVTETMTPDLKLISRWVANAQTLGFTVSIDDFGTGHSGLSLLTQLTPDKVKIDKLFLTDIDTSQQARDLLSGITNMLKGLGLSVVVEGVETQEELDFIGELDCDYAQGYLIGKPLTQQEALALFD